VPTNRQWRRIDTARAEADLLHQAAARLRDDDWREPLAGLSDHETGEALAELLDVLADHVIDLDAAVRWQAGEGAKLITGQPMAAPSVRRTRRR
jgi:hypothetical protein